MKAPSVCYVLLASVALIAGCGSDDGEQSAQSLSVQVTAPGDGSISRSARVSVRGTVSEGANVQVLGQPAQVSGSTFSSSVPLQRGDNRIDVTATKEGAQPATTSITITYPVKKESNSKPPSDDDDGNSGGDSDSGGSSSSASVGTRDCGGGVLVNSVTSCSFAFRVRAAFTAYGGPTVEVYSPVTQRTYTMTCTPGPGAQETCRGGNNAVVTF